MSDTIQLIQLRSYLRTKRGNLYSMANDTKSSAQFREICLQKIEEINKQMNEIQKLIEIQRKEQWEKWKKN